MIKKLLGIKSIYFILIIFILSLSLRIIYVISVGEVQLGGDEVGYDLIGWNLASGLGFVNGKSQPTAFVFPFYPLFLSFIYFIFGHSLFIARIFQAIISSLICILIYFIARIIFKREDISRLSAVISIIYPSLIIFSGMILNDLLVTFLVLLGIYFLLQGIELNKNIYLFFSGIFLGLLILTRGEYLIFLIMVLVWLIILKFSFKKLLVKYLILVFTSFILISPWIIRNYVALKKFPLLSTRAGVTLYNSYFLSDKGFGFNQIKNLNKEYFLLKTNVEKDKYLMRKGLEFIKKNPVVFIKLIPVKISMLFYPFDGKWYRGNLLSKYNLIYGIVFSFALLGIIFILKDKGKKSYLLLLLILQTMIVYSIFYGKPQYRLPLEPIFMIFASVGFFCLKEKFNKKFYFLTMGSIIVINLSLFFFSDSITKGLKELMDLVANGLPKG